MIRCRGARGRGIPTAWRSSARPQPRTASKSSFCSGEYGVVPLWCLRTSVVGAGRGWCPPHAHQHGAGGRRGQSALEENPGDHASTVHAGARGARGLHAHTFRQPSTTAPLLGFVDRCPPARRLPCARRPPTHMGAWATTANPSATVNTCHMSVRAPPCRHPAGHAPSVGSRPPTDAGTRLKPSRAQHGRVPEHTTTTTNQKPPPQTPGIATDALGQNRHRSPGTELPPTPLRQNRHQRPKTPQQHNTALSTANRGVRAGLAGPRGGKLQRCREASHIWVDSACCCGSLDVERFRGLCDCCE